MVKTLKFKIKKYKKIIIAWTCIIIFALLSVLMLKNGINSIISNTVELKSKALATKAMNSAIADVVINSIVYEDLVNIITDEFGNISMIKANALKINNLRKDLAQTTENKIEEYGRSGISIPFGSFTGIPVLVGRGPNIKLKVSPIGAVNCTFLSHFETAGINQTNHKIYLSISADVGVVLPLLSKKYNTTRQVLISESIIVGQVPEVYLYSDTLDTLLNFVPY